MLFRSLTDKSGLHSIEQCLCAHLHLSVESGLPYSTLCTTYYFIKIHRWMSPAIHVLHYLHYKMREVCLRHLHGVCCRFSHYQWYNNAQLRQWRSQRVAECGSCHINLAEQPSLLTFEIKRIMLFLDVWSQLFSSQRVFSHTKDNGLATPLHNCSYIYYNMINS